MKLIVIEAALLLAAAAACAQPPTSSVTPLTIDALFPQLGGNVGIDKLANDFVERLWVDPRIGAYVHDSGKKHLKTQLADQFCEVSGGPCRLDGPDMKTAYEAMAIGKGDFNARVEMLQSAMDRQGIPFTTQNRLLAQLTSMHRDIGHRP